MHARPVAPADEKFFNARLVRQLLERLLRVTDGKRYEDGARPGRNFVDVEPEPVWKQHDFGWDCRTGVVIVLPEKTQIELGECIDCGDAAHFKNYVARALEGRM